MSESPVRTDVLITVMTYPHPSRGHQELVCTAGLTRSGEWVRLYPIDYRYRPRDQQFRKYQWISVGLHPHGAGNDRRKESRKPELETIRVLGDPLPTSRDWAARRALIDPLPHHSVNELRGLYNADGTSLGIVRPTRILDLKIEDANREWKPEWATLFQQMRLFGEPQKPLAKLPYKFSYVFECSDSINAHNAMCEDWELGVLYLKEVDRLGSEKKAAESVRKKFLNELCAPDRDTRFFMGTVFPYNAWVVLGVLWPPKLSEPGQLPLL
ncbi:MAG: hypothetical protein JNL34_16835 [Anaerolineae bacterium]|nr:hypothetical protein [Anaerolineae bacterium]